MLRQIRHSTYSQRGVEGAEEWQLAHLAEKMGIFKNLHLKKLSVLGASLKLSKYLLWGLRNAIYPHCAKRIAH